MFFIENGTQAPLPALLPDDRLSPVMKKGLRRFYGNTLDPRGRHFLYKGTLQICAHQPNSLSGELGEDASLAQRDVAQERLAHSG